MSAYDSSTSVSHSEGGDKNPVGLDGNGSLLRPVWGRAAGLGGETQATGILRLNEMRTISSGVRVHSRQLGS